MTREMLKVRMKVQRIREEEILEMDKKKWEVTFDDGHQIH
jgi:hypothetical protein